MNELENDALKLKFLERAVGCCIKAYINKCFCKLVVDTCMWAVASLELVLP